MRNLVLLAHMSLDGFVAGSKGELDGFPTGEENLAFVNRLTEDADAAFLGRVSYQLLNNYWPVVKNLPGATKAEIEYSNWFSDAQKIVVSRTLSNEDLKNTTIVRNDIEKKINEIKKQAGKNILIFGSPSISQILMGHNLIDSYWIFINPVLFGEGIPLFRPSSTKKKNFKLLRTNRLLNGEIALNYVPC